MAEERHAFQAEVSQLLDLMVHSLYSDKEIFLRELVSNASDAIDKRRFEQLTKPELAANDEPTVRIEVDREKRTLSVADNGIGMTADEVVKNIGTIARSGTKEFLSAMKEAKRKELPPELIGQFGVGFYSAFMVASSVTLVTRRAGTAKATLWESSGDGSYVLGEAERDAAGTTVTLQLRPADEEQGLRDFTDEGVIRSIVRRYSDFVAYPIRMKTWKTKEGGASSAKVFEDETLNSMKAIWDRPAAEVSESEHREFYRHLSHDWNAPLRTIPVRMEGTLEAYALLYIPTKAPFDLYNQEMKRGLQLYVRRVFVMDECRDLVPPYLRFLRGVVDARDLPLNVSREILQKDRRIQIIRKQLVKKVTTTLEEMASQAPKEYREFWLEFGPVLKEGLLGFDGDTEKLLGLLRAASTHEDGELVSLDDYVGRMKEGQDGIYFLAGPSREAVATSPLLEAFAAKGTEVLLFADAVDEIWLERPPAFKGKPLVSIARGDVKLGSEEDRKKDAQALEEKKKEYGDLLNQLRVLLQDDIQEVRVSTRLTSSAVCLVGDEHALSPRMQKLLEQMGQSLPRKAKRILEVNPAHPILAKLQAALRANRDDPKLKLYADALLAQAHLAESGQVPDPASLNRMLGELMLGAV